jgi:MFS family permease
MGPETFAFATALMVNFVDMMGLQFTLPVTVPYGRWMGAGLQTIALSMTVRGLLCIVSNLWMPRLSDRKGRKLVIMISLFGSACAYVVQGLAGHFPETAITIFMIGRGLSGLFGGTMPVVRAYVTELSMPDVQLMKQRMTLLIVANQSAGIALAPIAGAIATFGLSLPYFVCSGVGLFGIIWAGLFFREAKIVKQLGSTAGAIGSAPMEKAIPAPFEAKGNANEGKLKKGKPWRDAVVILMFFAYISIFLLVSGYVLLIPVLLERPDFGLVGATMEETERNIAKAFGLVAVPNGLCNVLVSVLLFVPLTKKFGDVKVIMVGGLVASVSFATYGFWPTRLWQICVLQAISGCCFGVIIPAMGPLMARYASARYPRQIAETQAIPILGMNLSMACGQNLMALIADQLSLKAAWIVCGGCVFIFMIFFVSAYVLVQNRLPQGEVLNAEQKEIKLQIGGKDTDQFIDAMCEELRHLLSKSQAELWNAPMQHIVQKKLSAVVPSTRSWDNETHGREYLEDLHALLHDSPGELAKLEAIFPHVGIGNLGDMDCEAGVTALNIPSLTRTITGDTTRANNATAPSPSQHGSQIAEV